MGCCISHDLDSKPILQIVNGMFGNYLMLKGTRQALDVCTDRRLMMVEAEQLFLSLQHHVLPGLS